LTCLVAPVQLKLKLIYDRRSVGQYVLVSGSHLEPMTRFLFYVWQLRNSLCGAPSLTRGWVRNLLVQLLQDLARAVTLVSKTRRTHVYILLSHMILFQHGEPGPRICIPQEQGGPVIPEQLLLCPRPAELTTIFYCLIWDSSNMESQVPVFVSRKNRVAQLYPRAPGSIFVASYDS
jgi:hypothetical protein